MASVSLPSAFFTGLQNAAGASPIMTTAGAYLQLHPRTVAPPALPSLTSAVVNDASFHNSQNAFTGLFVDGPYTTGTPSFGAKGLHLGVADKIGTSDSLGDHTLGGTYWSEGIIAIEGPMATNAVQYIDSSGVGGGALKVIYTGGAWRFAAEHGLGGAATLYTFSTVTVPLSSNGSGSVPSPFYFRLLREMPSTGTGQYHLVVNDGTTTQTQTITGVTLTNPGARTASTFGYSTGPTINVYWWRGTGSATAATVGTLTSTYWSSPAIFENESFYSYATASTADSGTDDEYWYQIGITQGGAFTGITKNGGGQIKVRVAATNIAPTGSTASLFSGVYFSLQDTPEILSDPRGRYLAIEWRYEPGTEWPIGMGSVHILRDSNEFATATHASVPQSGTFVPLAVNGEGTSQGTLPYTVERTTQTSHTFRVHRARFSSPHTLARPLGTAPRRTFDVQWVLTQSERDSLVQFFEARDGGEEAFTWTAPGDSATSLAALTSALDINMLAPGAFDIRGQLTEVLDGS